MHLLDHLFAFLHLKHVWVPLFFSFFVLYLYTLMEWILLFCIDAVILSGLHWFPLYWNPTGDHNVHGLVLNYQFPFRLYLLYFGGFFLGGGGLTLFTRDLFQQSLQWSACWFFSVFCLNKTCERSACMCLCFYSDNKRTMKFTELLVNINATMHIFMRIKSPTPPLMATKTIEFLHWTRKNFLQFSWSTNSLSHKLSQMLPSFFP